MLTSIAIILLLGFISGQIFTKMKLPSLIGMILVGILISPYCLDLMDESILSISKDIRQRVYTSIKTKIIGNYERRNFWWETSKYNWSAVCSCGIGLAYLYLFPERFNLVKHRLLRRI